MASICLERASTIAKGPQLNVLDGLDMDGLYTLVYFGRPRRPQVYSGRWTIIERPASIERDYLNFQHKNAEKSHNFSKFKNSILQQS